MNRTVTVSPVSELLKSTEYPAPVTNSGKAPSSTAKSVGNEKYDPMPTRRVMSYRLTRHKISDRWRGRVSLQVVCGSHLKWERGAASGSLHRQVRPHLPSEWS